MMLSCLNWIDHSLLTILNVLLQGLSPGADWKPPGLAWSDAVTGGRLPNLACSPDIISHSALRTGFFGICQANVLCSYPLYTSSSSAWVTFPSGIHSPVAGVGNLNGSHHSKLRHPRMTNHKVKGNLCHLDLASSKLHSDSKVWAHAWQLHSVFDCFTRVFVCLLERNLFSFDILKQYYFIFCQ